MMTVSGVTSSLLRHPSQPMTWNGISFCGHYKSRLAWLFSHRLAQGCHEAYAELQHLTLTLSLMEN